jgi:acyl carrier protein
MTTQEIHAKLANIISQKVDQRIAVERIRLDSRLRVDLGIDSLAVTELLYEIEDVFGVLLEVSDPEALQTVADAVKAISRGLPIARPAA